VKPVGARKPPSTSEIADEITSGCSGTPGCRPKEAHTRDHRERRIGWTERPARFVGCFEGSNDLACRLSMSGRFFGPAIVVVGDLT